MATVRLFICDKCGQPLGYGKIPCKAKSLDVCTDGRVALELEVTCPKCGGPIIVRWFLYCSIREAKNDKQTDV